MMEFRYIDESLRDAWEKLVCAQSARGFMQSFFWSDFKRKTGWDTFKIGVLEKNILIGGAVIMKFNFSKTKNFLYLPEGPVLNYADKNANKIFHALMEEINKIADLKGAQLTTHIRIDPRIFVIPPCFKHFQKAPYNMEPRNTLMMDLTMSEKELLARMKPKCRYNIKIAEREGVEIVEIEPSIKAVSHFAPIYQETVTRKKFDKKDNRYFEILFEHLKETKNGRLFFAEYKGKILAAALVIFYGDTATYFFGASSNTQRNKMAPYKLHWEIIRAAKERSYRWYDFWGVAPATANASHGWYGFTQFKNKFGGERFDFIGAHDFVYNKKLYAEFLRESGERED